jgi:ABC-type uncharacterized transport system involved in gliding motility auxiliary subunit
MEITSRTRLVLGTQTAVFVVLLLSAVAMLAWVSEHYKLRWDWTAASRNTLTEPSRELLLRLDGAIDITAYVREEPVIRQSILQLLERYQRYKPDIRLRFVNPDLVPDEVRARNISADGEMVVSYRQREEHAKVATEEALTTALEKLARGDTRWVTYLSGRGERDLLGGASYDLGKLGAQLQRQGFKLHQLDLDEAGEIPAESAMLVISPGRQDVPADEVDAVLRYLNGGGNLLWLAEPGSSRGMDAIAAALGIRFEAGVLVDPTTRVLGISHPAFVPVSAYPTHPVTGNLELVTVFPHAVGISWNQPQGWQTRGILSTGLRAWSETGALEGELGFDDSSDVSGPLDIGIAMQRMLAADDGQSEDRKQRVIVIGDGDFLSNAYLGSGSNLNLALNVFNWLADDETLIDIPARSAPDLSFELSRTSALLMRFGVMFALPIVLLGTGFFIWHRRRRL